MTGSQSDRQAKYTAAQKARGFTQVRLWVPVSKRDALREIAAKMCDDERNNFVTQGE